MDTVFFVIYPTSDLQGDCVGATTGTLSCQSMVLLRAKMDPGRNYIFHDRGLYGLCACDIVSLIYIKELMPPLMCSCCVVA